DSRSEYLSFAHKRTEFFAPKRLVWSAGNQSRQCRVRRVHVQATLCGTHLDCKELVQSSPEATRPTLFQTAAAAASGPPAPSSPRCAFARRGRAAVFQAIRGSRPALAFGQQTL